MSEVIRARVISVQRESYLVRTEKCEKTEYMAHLNGNLREAEQFPIVGDYVQVLVDDYDSALIMAIEKRKI